MYCKHCGNRIPDNTKFCPNCGSQVSDSIQDMSTDSDSTSQQPAPQKQANRSAKPKKAIYKKWWFWLIIAIVLLSMSKSCSSSSHTTAQKKTPSTQSTQNNNQSESISDPDSSQKATSTPKPTAGSLIDEYEITYIYFDPYSSSFGVYYDAIVEITNTGNTSLYIDKKTFDIEDEEGHLIDTYDFVSNVPDVIAPGEKGYIYVDPASLDDDLTDLDNLVFVPHITVKRATGTPQKLEVEDCSLYANDYGTVGVRGRLINDSDEDISYIYVTVVFYNTEGVPLGIGGVNVTDILANDKTSFDVSGISLPSQATIDNVADYVVYAETMYLQW